MKKGVFIVVGLILLPSHARCEGYTGEVSFPEPKGWKVEVSPRVYTPENLWDLINGAAESYLSYDFIDLHLADYRSRGGIVVHAEVYRHSTEDNAFGIYSAERSPEYNFIAVGTQGYLEEGVLNYFTGPFYVKLYSTESGPDVQVSLQLIGKGISDRLGQVNEWSPLLTSFPPEGKIENTERYTRDNFLGLDFLRDAYTVEYEGGYKLFLIRGRNQDDVLEMVRAYLEFTGQETDPLQDNVFTVRDRYNGNIPVVIKGSFLAGIIDGADNETARKSLDVLADKVDALAGSPDP
jgi:hypothetical protein